MPLTLLLRQLLATYACAASGASPGEAERC